MYKKINAFIATINDEAYLSLISESKEGLIAKIDEMGINCDEEDVKLHKVEMFYELKD